MFTGLLMGTALKSRANRRNLQPRSAAAELKEVPVGSPNAEISNSGAIVTLVKQHACSHTPVQLLCLETRSQVRSFLRL